VVSVCNRAVAWSLLILVSSAIGCLVVVPGVTTLVLSAKSASRTEFAYFDIPNDPAFRTALMLTIVYVVIAVGGQMAVGLFSAIHVYLARRPGVLFIIYFSPYAVPVVSGTLAWRWMFERNGFIAAMLSGVIAPHRWFGDLVMVLICLASVWQFYAFVTAALVARLRKIPGDLNRAAWTDGCGIRLWWRLVAWPQVRGVVVAVVVLRVVFMFTKFDTPWLLAGNTSNPHARVLTVYIAERLLANPLSASGLAAALTSAAILAMFVVAVARYVVSGTAINDKHA